jgi:hypothetical protein
LSVVQNTCSPFAGFEIANICDCVILGSNAPGEEGHRKKGTTKIKLAIGLFSV